MVSESQGAVHGFIIIGFNVCVNSIPPPWAGSDTKSIFSLFEFGFPSLR